MIPNAVIVFVAVQVWTLIGVWDTAELIVLIRRFQPPNEYIWRVGAAHGLMAVIMFAIGAVIGPLAWSLPCVVWAIGPIYCLIEIYRRKPKKKWRKAASKVGKELAARIKASAPKGAQPSPA